MLNFFEKKSSEIILLAGLGNPGDKYQGHRHNVGFMAIDAIADEYSFSSFRSKFQGEFSEGRIDGQKVVLLKPMTMMNNSGQSVKAASKFFKIPASQIIVFHDELDLDPGKMRVKQGGGNAGHNGLRSIQSHMGTADFIRVRIGIGHPGDKNRVHSYVLKDFAKAEHKWLHPLLSGVASYVGYLINGDSSNFMSRTAQQIHDGGK